MYRRQEKVLKEWLQTSRKALLLTGARQIGKTWLIRHVLQESGYAYFEIFAKRHPMDAFVHERLLSLFFVYLIVGGMPEAVKAFLKTKDIRAVGQVHRDIYEQYKADFTKYEQEDRKLKLISVCDLIPSELNKQNKRFIFTYLNKELKFDRYENSFLWLKDAGAALPVYNAEVPRVPLISGKSSNLFKRCGDADFLLFGKGTDGNPAA